MCYTRVIRVLYACYTCIIRELYVCYTRVIRVLYACYTFVIHELYLLIAKSFSNHVLTAGSTRSAGPSQGGKDLSSYSSPTVHHPECRPDLCDTGGCCSGEWNPC